MDPTTRSIIGLAVLPGALTLGACGGGTGHGGDATPPEDNSTLAPAAGVDPAAVGPAGDSRPGADAGGANGGEADASGTDGSPDTDASGRVPVANGSGGTSDTGSIAPVETLVATWESPAELGSSCTIHYTFGADHRFSSESAEERRVGFYGVEAEPNGNGRRRLQLTFTSDNGRPDCLGLNDDETGLRFMWWIELSGFRMEWFDGPDAGAQSVRDWRLGDGAVR